MLDLTVGREKAWKKSALLLLFVNSSWKNVNQPSQQGLCPQMKAFIVSKNIYLRHLNLDFLWMNWKKVNGEGLGGTGLSSFTQFIRNQCPFFGGWVWALEETLHQKAFWCALDWNAVSLVFSLGVDIEAGLTLQSRFWDSKVFSSKIMMLMIQGRWLW